jgi:DNA polymerase I-like protein with 3'-5' exonuclease and polymerase domains
MVTHARTTCNGRVPTPRQIADKLRAADLVTADQVIELRAVKVKTRDFRRAHTRSGFFDPGSRETACEAALRLEQVSVGVYYTLNPVKSELLARRSNQVDVADDGEATKDKEIACRRVILIDADPVRPALISATDAEKAAAREVIDRVRTYLTELGFPPMVLADSSNGYHLLLRVELPNDDVSTELVKNFLAALHARFSTDAVKIDETTFNAARITKFYGTVARKGSSTADRPHRRSAIIDIPDGVAVVPVELLQKVAADAPKPPPADATASGTTKPILNMPRYLAWAKFDFRIKSTKGPRDTTVRILKTCVFNATHGDHGEVCVTQEPNGKPGYKCWHDECRGKGWKQFIAKVGKPLDEHYDPPRIPKKAKKQSCAEVLVKLSGGADLFHDHERKAFASVGVNGHVENYAVRNAEFKRWLSHAHYAKTGKPPSAASITDALTTIEAKAIYEGPRRPTAVRVAEQDGKFYLDLANDKWEVVEVDADGWRVIPNSPVKFRRRAGNLPLPTPTRGGCLDDFRRLINCPADVNWRLLVGWLLAALRPTGPYPILSLHGEHGAAKSSACRFSRRLIDPNTNPLRSEPKEARDLAIAANNCWVLAFDNLSRMPDWLSNALCRLATGGGFSTRQLYSDDDEVLFDAQRPAIVNGISAVGDLADLLDRSLLIELPEIPEDARRPEKALVREFEAAAPGVLGALLDAVAVGIREMSSTTLPRLPRMADFCLWVTACESGLGWAPGTFATAYDQAQETAVDQALGAAVIYEPLLKMTESHPPGTRWASTATKLLLDLKNLADDVAVKDHGWPKKPDALSRQLKRIAPELRRTGLLVRWPQRLNRVRIIEIEKVGKTASPASPASPTSAQPTDTEGQPSKSGQSNGSDERRHHGVTGVTTASPESSASTTSPGSTASPAANGVTTASPENSEFPRVFGCGDASDASDAVSRHFTSSSDPAPAPPYVLIIDPTDLTNVLPAIERSQIVGVDCETTSLDPLNGRIRLLQLACDAPDHSTITYIIDAFTVDLSPLWRALRSRPIVAHNAKFELSFLTPIGFVPGDVRCTMLMSQVLRNSAERKPTKHSLADVALRELGLSVDKEQQCSDWSGDLSAAQLHYAALDAALPRRLHTKMAPELEAAGLTRTVNLECRALPAIAWMTAIGVGFDQKTWPELAAAAKADAEAASAELTRRAPRPQEDGWNWNSPKQVKQAFAATGTLITDTTEATLKSLNSPLADALLKYRAATKRVGTYGDSWLEFVGPDGRIHSDWRQIGARSGRMACRNPNLQNLPRDQRYRKCFVAAPDCVLVKADYSQIELRIAAKLSGDERMRDAYLAGEDLHAATAKTILKKARVSRQDRQLAKSVNFGLVYGMSAKTLRTYARANYGVELTPTEAERYRDAFFAAYPGLKRWHDTWRNGDESVDTRTLIGRRCVGVAKFAERLNYPDQGSGADGMKAALALLWERRAQCPEARPVLAAHDEIVVECPKAGADAAATWLRKAMIDAMAPMIAPIPVVVELNIGATWGG